MKTVSNSNSNMLIVTEHFKEFIAIIVALRAQDRILNARISGYRESMNKINLITATDEEKNQYELYKLYDEEACNERKYNFALLRQLEDANRGHVDLEISPYILTTDLTTLRGWL